MRFINRTLLLLLLLLSTVLVACADDGEDANADQIIAEPTALPTDPNPDAPMVIDAPGDDPIDEDQLVPGNDPQPLDNEPTFPDPTFSMNIGGTLAPMTLTTDNGTVAHDFEEPENVSASVSGSPTTQTVGLHDMTFDTEDVAFKLRFSDNVIEGFNIPLVFEQDDMTGTTPAPLTIGGSLTINDTTYNLVTDAELTLESLNEDILTGSFALTFDETIEVSGAFANVRYNTADDEINLVDQGD